MRIIAGSAKRRSLKVPSAAQGVRPILGRIKKSLFDILGARVPGAVFLDLYAGSGAVGIEALSRGASSVTFVDRNPSCLSIIRQNLSRLRLFDHARVLRADATRDLGMAGGPFDIIFMGPPYHDDKWNAHYLTLPTLQAIHRAQILKADGIVVGQHHVKEPTPEVRGWRLSREQVYGDTLLSFFLPELSSAQ